MIKWVDVAGALNNVFNNIVKPAIVSGILTALGLAGAFWTWLVGLFVSWGWTKADKEIKSQARLKDQENVDDALLNKYKEDIKNDVPESQLIEDETNILNGGRK